MLLLLELLRLNLVTWDFVVIVRCVDFAVVIVGCVDFAVVAALSVIVSVYHHQDCLILVSMEVVVHI